MFVCVRVARKCACVIYAVIFFIYIASITKLFIIRPKIKNSVEMNSMPQ